MCVEIETKNFKNSYFDVKNKENFQVEMINSVVVFFQFKFFFQDSKVFSDSGSTNYISERL